ncbi:hypothetical protein TNIN_317961 [Trichonephila inaurata madagascariensis]|uniref:Uncharacterized protein n=1 Tax=Trichonephila inaurata madagascariensis TaxID=2747483 RepID=A0A8X6WRH9_9ARAC|nr:hypothetical protein TNIN_317961 [Trichonephila inaurata madagascariensis]
MALMVFHSRKLRAIETIDLGVVETLHHAPFRKSGGRQLATGVTCTLRRGGLWKVAIRTARAAVGRFSNCGKYRHRIVQGE